MKYLLLIFIPLMAFADFDYQAQVGLRYKVFPDDDRDDTKDYQLDLKTRFQSDYEVDSYRFHLGFFSRVDQNNSKRNILNFDETYLKKSFNSMSVSVGNHIFNWSVLEVFHPVDTINAKNFDSNGDLIERLGLPSVIIHKEFETSLFQFIAVIQNIPSIFPDDSNRNGALIDFKETKYVNDDQTIEDSPDMFEFIVRYQHNFENFDMDIHYARKYDTNNPLISSPRTQNNSPTIEQLEITPYYLKMHQYGVTLQKNWDAYIIKFEHARYDYDQDSVELFIPPTFSVQNTKEDFSLTAFGIERTFTYGNDAEGTFFFEYQTVLGTTQDSARILSPFQRDAALGYRHNFNDFKGHEILAFLINDVDHFEERIYSLSHSYRVIPGWKLETGIRIIEAQNPKNGLDLSNFEGLRAIANGDSFNIELTRFF